MSAQSDILNSCKDAVEALAITNLTVIVRKDLIISDDDSLPLVVLAPGRPSIDSEHTENTIVYVRPVFVGIAESTGEGKLESDVGTLLTVEDQIRKSLHKPLLSGASTGFDADISPDSLFIPGGIKAGYDMTIFRVDFLSTESRSN